MNEDKVLLADKENPVNNTPEELMTTTMEKVVSILDENFPGYLSFGNGSFTISQGSSQVMIVVRPFTHDDSCVECVAHVVHNASITEDLMRFLLRKNSELHFGSFGLLFDGTISFQHSITGENLDANELITTVKSVATISDYYDDIIVNAAGGKRAIDMIEELD